MQFSDLDLTKTYTYADYLKWTFDERVELIKGRVFPLGPSPGTVYHYIRNHLLYELYTHLREKTCEVFRAPFDIRFPNHSINDDEIITVVQPDMSVICDPEKIDKKGGIGVPDIVIEILTDGNNRTKLKDKFNLYEESGVLEYWIIFSVSKTFVRYNLVDGYFKAFRPLTFGDELTTPILPGFVLYLDELFADRKVF